MKNRTHLIERENRLYLEVNQLRNRLFLGHTSFLYQFISLFVQTSHDITKIFRKNNNKNISESEEKKRSIKKLKKQKTFLIILSKSPYMWIIKIVLFFSHIKRTPLKKNDIKNKITFIYGTSPYNRLQSRSIQITRALSKKTNCVYIENVFEETKKPGFRILLQEQNLTVVRVCAREALHISYQSPTKENKKILKHSIRLLIFSFPNSEIVHYVHHSFWYPLLPKTTTFWYDKSTDIKHFHNTTKYIVKIEKQIIRSAQKITTSNASFFPKKKNIKVIPNTVDGAVFKSASKSIDTCSVGLCWIKKPVIGYIGTLDERIDEELVARLAESFPSASFVFLGNTDYRPLIDVAEKHKNIFPIGEKEYDELPKYLQSFDVLILPYKQIKNAVMSHPELPLYLISGKPVVATMTKDMQPIKKYTYLATTQSEWTRQLTEAIKEKKRSKKKYLRIALSKKMVD